MKSQTLIFAGMRALGASVALTGLLAAGSSLAAPLNLVVNGGFETNGGNGQVGTNTAIANWSSVGGYNFLFAPGTADTTGADGWSGALTLWGAANGGANPLATSNDGGYFFGGDGDYFVAPLAQTISGMTPGRQYELSFEWAAAQQAGFYGPTTSAWIVYFGGEVMATDIQANASQSSSAWRNASMIFTATSSTALLEFLARGTPEGEPPFSLLDGVSLVEVGGEPVPEPTSWLLFGAAVAAGLMARRRRPAA